MQARKQQLQLEGFGRLSQKQQSAVLQMPSMQYMSKCEVHGEALHIQGDKQLVTQIQARVAGLVAAMHACVPNYPPTGFPNHWDAQQSKTELFEVDLGSTEIKEQMTASSHKVKYTLSRYRLAQSRQQLACWQLFVWSPL
ncbi:hypothetical protein ABBQ32_004553 [Trebouxia sp. C0010 RCD-2024]